MVCLCKYRGFFVYKKVFYLLLKVFVVLRARYQYLAYICIMKRGDRGVASIKLTTMSKVKCFSVRLESLISISEKCYKATAFDGSTALIPKSQVFGQDYDVSKSDAWWISAWILEQKDLQYSSKKGSFFDK